MASRASPEEIYNVVAPAFDVEFYFSINDDVAAAGLDPVWHFVNEGWREGRDPAPWFSSSGFAEDYPEFEGANGFYHYLTTGWRQGLATRPSEFATIHIWKAADAGRIEVAAPSSSPAPPPERARPAQAPVESASANWTVSRDQLLTAFDPQYYLEVNPDVAAAGIDPLDHFLEEGWREGRAPSRNFSVSDYLEFNPDVAALGINPFLHYVVAGRSEGRLGVHDLGFRHRMLAQLETVPERQARARRSAQAFKADPAAMLDVLKGASGPLHITFSHDDFTAHVGGLQLCLQRELAGLKARKIDHLHLYPPAPWPTLRPDGEPGLVGVLWNGRRLGMFKASLVAKALAPAAKSAPDGRRTFAIHSLLGHSVADVLEVLKAARIRKGHLWLHDFTSVCAGFHLMRNDVADCGAPPPDSPACSICVYGDHRRAHVEGHERLFAALDITIAAPSASAYETWRSATTAPADMRHVVHPHAALIPTERAKAAGKKAPLKVAYVGMTALHKGWTAFEELAEAFADDDRYAFLHLGSQKAVGSRVAFRPVSVSAAGPDAMRDALAEEAVDVVVLWSLCRETFSLAAHEAASAGAFILTHADSGNIAAFARLGDFGRVLDSEEDLALLFSTGQVTDYARNRRKPMLYDLRFSETTADLLEPAR